jgi:hypothetical protein
MYTATSAGSFSFEQSVALLQQTELVQAPDQFLFNGTLIDFNASTKFTVIPPIATFDLKAFSAILLPNGNIQSQRVCAYYIIHATRFRLNVWIVN